MFSERLQRFADAIERAGLDCFFAHDPTTTGYLQGFHEGAGERFMILAIRPNHEVRMICPALSETQARRAGIENVQGWKDGQDPLTFFGELAQDWNLESAIIGVDANMPARLLLQLQGALPAALFRNGEGVVSELTRVKDAQELEAMRKAGKIADDAFAEVAPKIRAGMTEREVSKMLSEAMDARGGTPVFSIVATGAGAAEPHHLSDDTRLQRGDVVILDFGCDYQGYKSDITRTVAVGEASERARKVYDLVYRSHMAGRAAVRAGVPAEQVDAAARDVIEEGGFGPYFFHRLGHGIGQQVHESPNLVKGNTDPLEAGNCFSVEPGIYLAGELGVRIENIIACTADGHESMNVDPASEIQIVG